jgi:hypothetical protein
VQSGLIVQLDPAGDGSFGGLKVGEVFLPGEFLLEESEEAFHEAILLGGKNPYGRDTGYGDLKEGRNDDPPLSYSVTVNHSTGTDRNCDKKS